MLHYYGNVLYCLTYSCQSPLLKALSQVPWLMSAWWHWASLIIVSPWANLHCSTSPSQVGRGKSKGKCATHLAVLPNLDSSQRLTKYSLQLWILFNNGIDNIWFYVSMSWDPHRSADIQLTLLMIGVKVKWYNSNNSRNHHGGIALYKVKCLLELCAWFAFLFLSFCLGVVWDRLILSYASKLTRTGTITNPTIQCWRIKPRDVGEWV